MSSALVNNRCTPSPPNSPGGRLMLCITNNSIAPAGLSSQFGDGIYSPPASKPCASIHIIRATRILDTQPLHPVAHGAERQSQQLGGCRAIKSGLFQCFQQGLLLDAVQI